MSETAKLILPGDKSIDLAVYEGTENEKCIDITKLRAQTGYITYDQGFSNTCPAFSEITYLDGEAGILRYRGYTIEDLCENSDFLEVCYLVMYGEMPSKEEYAEFVKHVNSYSKLDDRLLDILSACPQGTHPMVMVSMALGSLSAFYPEYINVTPDNIDEACYVALGQLLAIVAFAYRRNAGLPFEYPELEGESFASLFMKTMFGKDYDVDPDVEKVMDQLLILHADHEFNCSTSTVRIVGSSQATLFASLSAGVCALWGPLHGGANQAVLEMLQQVEAGGGDVNQFVEMAKDKSNPFRLMGFGHRVYKNYDPRAKIIKKTCDKVMEKFGKDDPLLNIAVELEKAALADSYFSDRKLYPNVDFYSGIVYRALGIPTEMFTPLFALGRIPGWIAHWREQHLDKTTRIGRPRQVYQGATLRSTQD